MLEFIHHSPLKMIKHLRTFRGDLDLTDVTELNTKLLKSWDYVKAPATIITLAIALSVFKASGKYNTLIREWNARATNHKTFDNFAH
ncbi:hypothetical protein ACHAW6_007817 [Cyclotella cf. meneghiniana]